MWLDDYDVTAGAYAAFKDRDRCLAYLTDTVLERAELLGADVLDLTPEAYDKVTETYPKIGRREVREALDRTGRFSLALIIDYDGTVINQVTVIMEKVDIQ